MPAGLLGLPALRGVLRFRCDAHELCNGITGVQYLVCKTWREAIPMALAWVALIEVRAKGLRIPAEALGSVSTR